MQELMLQFQKLMISQKKIILLGFSSLWALIIAGIVGGTLLGIYDPSLLNSFHYGLGHNFGTIALLFYLSTLIPGILKRLGILTPIRAGLMIYRRHLGITMWWMALIHYVYVMMLRIVILGAPLPQQLVYTSSFFALILSFWLWVTANDLSVKKLGKWWRRLHKLTYLILILIFIHVALLQTKWAIATGLVLIIEIISWLKVWFFSKSNSKGKIDSQAVTTTAEDSAEQEK